MLLQGHQTPLIKTIPRQLWHQWRLHLPRQPQQKFAFGAVRFSCLGNFGHHCSVANAVRDIQTVILRIIVTGNLFLKTLQHHRISVIQRHFDDDIATDLLVDRLPDGAHSALAKVLGGFVSLVDDLIRFKFQRS